MRATRTTISILWVVLLGTLLFAAAAPAEAARLDRALEKAAGGAPTMVEIIVQTRDRPTFKDRTLVGAYGGEAGLPFSTIHGFPARVPAPALKGLANSPRFNVLSIDASMKPLWDHNPVRPPAGVPEAFRFFGATGAGVGVAVVDSGAAKHEDFDSGSKSSIRAFVDFLSTSSSASDAYGHGTHVAGILSGRGGAVEQFSGVAPGASLYILRVLDGGGSGTVSNVLRALDWIKHNADTYGIRVVNLSLGHPVYESYSSDPLCRAVEDLVKRGIVVVAAAGNYGRLQDGTTIYGGITSPGNSPFAITVGAMNPKGTASRSDDVIASFSSRGPTAIDGTVKPDLVANGVFSVSLNSPGSYFETHYSDLHFESSIYGASNGSDDYYLMSGTSMAAPVVSGIVALMLQKNPSLTPTLVKGILHYTAEDRGYDVMTQGAGYVNAPGAVEAAIKVTTRPESYEDDAYWLVAPLSGQSTIQGEAVLWGGRVLYDQAVLWSGFTASGGIIAYNFEELWGLAVLWGSKGALYSLADEFEDLGIQSSAVLWQGMQYDLTASGVLWDRFGTMSDVVYGEGFEWHGGKGGGGGGG